MLGAKGRQEEEKATKIRLTLKKLDLGTSPLTCGVVMMTVSFCFILFWVVCNQVLLYGLESEMISVGVNGEGSWRCVGR